MEHDDAHDNHTKEVNWYIIYSFHSIIAVPVFDVSRDIQSQNLQAHRNAEAEVERRTETKTEASRALQNLVKTRNWRNLLKTLVKPRNLWTMLTWTMCT